MVGNCRFHRWHDAKGLMNPAEIVIDEVSASACSWPRCFFEKAFVRRVTLQQIKNQITHYLKKTCQRARTWPGVMAEMNRHGFCVFIHTLCQGAVPSLYENDKLMIFATEVEAQREIADFAMERLQQFMNGERDFDDAISVEEYVMKVEVLPDGSVKDGHGNHFGPAPL